MKPTANVKDILWPLKHNKKKKKKKDSGTILETSNIKSVRSALNFQSLFGL